MSVVRRAEVDDFYVDGHESAILVDGNVLVLSELATALLLAVGDDEVGLPAIAGALEAAFGRPADGSVLEATEDAVAALVEAGVLARSDLGQ